MRKLIVLGVLVLAGCQNVRGPLQPRPPLRVDDPRLPISEQQKLARERLALPEESPQIAPGGGAARPGTFSR
jgi:hypothetical protein